MNQYKQKNKELEEENRFLLMELEKAYKNLETVLQQSKHEQDIAYEELDNKYEALENLYEQLSNKENMLVHLEKLSSIGQFITEIIHELNNPLNVINGVTDILLYGEISDATKENLEKISSQVDRMTNYLNRFKVMAYKGEQDFVYFDLNENVKNFIDTIDIIKPKSINIKSNLSDDTLKVWGDPYQTTQIFLNLAKNAFDALKENGQELEIITKRVNSDWVNKKNLNGEFSCQGKKEWQSIIDNSKSFALVEIKDDGTGIPNDFLPNIFDAFFTSKERGKGTGLGLSIATDISKRHNSNLTVKSELGVGTTFSFIMPLINKVSKSKTKLNLKAMC